MEIALAIGLGLLFGFVLHRVGASNPNLILGMLSLKNLHLMKAILLGIAIATAGLFLGLASGLIDPAHLDIKSSHWGVVVGGLILGVGWAIAGYCPGTAIAGLGEGRRDALVFILGGLLGAGIYMLSFDAIDASGLLADLLQGKSSLGATGNAQFPALLTVPPLLIAGVQALLFGVVAFLLPAPPKANTLD